MPGDRVSRGYSGAQAHQKGGRTHGGLPGGQSRRPAAAGRPQSRRVGDEDPELADLSLAARPGDKTSYVTLETLPNLLELPLPRG